MRPINNGRSVDSWVHMFRALTFVLLISVHHTGGNPSHRDAYYTGEEK